MTINKSKINKPALKTAIAALRSGKYKQGTLELKDSDCYYCVLGVLAEVSGIGYWGEDTARNGRYFINPDHQTYPEESSSVYLSKSLKDYYGFDSGNPRVYIDKGDEGDEDMVDLISLNDSINANFESIANLLEKTYLSDGE